MRHRLSNLAAINRGQAAMRADTMYALSSNLITMPRLMNAETWSFYL
jgi:hypothetical protein